MTREEYNKTWYIQYTLPSAKCPENWITATPIKLFGIAVLVKWKLAKPNYPWAKN